MSRTWHLTENEATAAVALMMIGSLMMAYRYEGIEPDAQEMWDALRIAHMGCSELGVENLAPLLNRLNSTIKDI